MKEKKVANDRGIPMELRQLKSKIELLKGMVQTVSLQDVYIPNKKDHLFKWGQSAIKNAFLRNSVDSSCCSFCP